MEWKERLKQEYKEVADREYKLHEFLQTPENSEQMTTQDWNLLCTQRDIMHAYTSILETRMCNNSIEYTEVE